MGAWRSLLALIAALLAFAPAAYPLTGDARYLARTRQAGDPRYADAANRFPADHPDPNLRGLVKELRVKNGQVIQRDLGNPFAVRFLAACLEAFPQ